MVGRHVFTVFKWKEASTDEIVRVDVLSPTMKLPQDVWNWMNERRYELRLQRLEEMERMEGKEGRKMSSRIGPVSEAGLILLALAASIASPVLVGVFKQFGGISLDLKSPGPLRA